MSQPYVMTPGLRKELEAWQRKWVQNAHRTGQYTDDDKAAICKSMDALYTVVGVEPPARQVFVKSPSVAAAAGCMAQGIWWLRRNAAEQKKFLGVVLTEQDLGFAVQVAVDALRQHPSLTGSDAFELRENKARSQGVQDSLLSAVWAAAGMPSWTHATGFRKETPAGRVVFNADVEAMVELAVTVTSPELDVHVGVTDLEQRAAQAASEAASQEFVGSVKSLLETSRYAVTGIRGGIVRMGLLGQNEAGDAVSFAETADLRLPMRSSELAGAVTASLWSAAIQRAALFLLECMTQWSQLYSGGNQEAAWQAFLSFFRHVMGWSKGSPELDHLEQLATFGPRVMLRDFWIISDWPLAINTDPDGRAHSEKGPALAWADGRQQFFWHGTEIPADWILNKDGLNPMLALEERNAERRRAAAEIIGWNKVVEHLGAKVIHEDPDPEIGTLLECDLPNAPRSRFLKVRCGTGRWFCIPVPENMQTARQANAWTWSLEPDQYHPEVRA